MIDSTSGAPTAAEVAVLGRQVFCDDELGLAWSVVESLPVAPFLARVNGRNEVVLRTLSLVEEHDETQAENAERAELHRLEAKLNLVLELLAELVMQRASPLPPRPLRFNSHGLCWVAEDAFELDALLRVECYVLPAWPVPLELYVRVRSIEPSDGRVRVCASIEGLSEGAATWLDKLVFRRHRRAIAQRRTRG